jgi:hypothetical protein
MTLQRERKVAAVGFVTMGIISFLLCFSSPGPHVSHLVARICNAWFILSGVVCGVCAWLLWRADKC